MFWDEQQKTECLPQSCGEQEMLFSERHRPSAIHVKLLYKLQWYQWTLLNVYVRNTAILQYILVLDQAANILLKLLKVLQTSFLVLKCIVCTNKVSSLAEQLACVCLVVLYSYIYFYCTVTFVVFLQTCL